MNTAPFIAIEGPIGAGKTTLATMLSQKFGFPMIDLFHREGLEISTALAPKTSATQQGRWYEAHDYRAHGEIVDFVVLMTYEWGYSGGPPQAVSPIGPVRDVIEYALTEMPANKIVMGQNLYGYDWTLPYTAGGTPARAVSPQQAIVIADRSF